jgi:ABC-type phosphate/phosphonate transport system substrate-binding protein
MSMQEAQNRQATEQPSEGSGAPVDAQAATTVPAATTTAPIPNAPQLASSTTEDEEVEAQLQEALLLSQQTGEDIQMGDESNAGGTTGADEGDDADAMGEDEDEEDEEEKAEIARAIEMSIMQPEGGQKEGEQKK